MAQHIWLLSFLLHLLLISLGDVVRAATGGKGPPDSRPTAAVNLRLEANTGIQLLHSSTQMITSHELNFASTQPRLAIEYSIVDQAEHGVVECVSGKQKRILDFQPCTTFTQRDVDAVRVRYRHTSGGRPAADSFSFQVRCGSASSALYTFNIRFVPVTIRVRMEQPILLNNSEEVTVDSQNLHSMTFPRSFSPAQLIYHIVEPPRLGMLSRRLPNNGGVAKPRNRRIGVSSNFSQEHVNAGQIGYRINFPHYSIERDFFSFRVITPAAVSELLYAEVSYLPGSNSLNLLNRTLVLGEGASQALTNNTLWLETPDEKHFRFVIAVPPLHGVLTMVNEMGGKFHLTRAGEDGFSSEELASRRVTYEHCGDESRADTVMFVAESLLGGRESSSSAHVPIWLSIHIIGENDHKPELLARSATPSAQLQPDNDVRTGFSTVPLESDRNFVGELGKIHEVVLLQRGGVTERLLHPSLFPWFDEDDSYANSSIPTSPPIELAFHFSELYRDFIICKHDTPEDPINNFTTRDLRARSLRIRHIRHTAGRGITAKYSVSDGVHTSHARLSLRSLPVPMVRWSNDQDMASITVPSLGGENADRYLLVTPFHLHATTNVDVDLDEISYQLSPSDTLFRLLVNGSLLPTLGFRQRDILENSVFLALADVPLQRLPLTINLTLSASNPSSTSAQSYAQVEIALEKRRIERENIRPPTAILTLCAEKPITFEGHLPTTVDSRSLGVALYPSSVGSDGKVKYAVVKAAGTLTFGRKKHGHPLYGSIAGFTARDLTPGHLYYSPPRGENGGELFIEALAPLDGLPSHKIGPLMLSFQQLGVNEIFVVAASGLSVHKDSDLPIDGRALQLVTPRDDGAPNFDYSSLEYRLVKNPQMGVLARRQKSNSIYPTAHSNMLSSFSHKELLDGAIVYLPLNISGTTPEENFSVAACLSIDEHEKCSPPAQLRIKVEVSPDAREEAVGGSGEHWHTTPHGAAKKQNPSATIATPHTARHPLSSPANELLAQSSAVFTPVLDTNFKLNVAPGVATIIGWETLRAKSQPNIPPQAIFYRITSRPLHGKLHLEGEARVVDSFTQEDVDSRRLTYKSLSRDLGAWSLRDQFGFRLELNDEHVLPRAISRNAKNASGPEFFFRASISYANIPSTRLEEFAPRQEVVVSQGGSMLINSFHLNLTMLSAYCDDQLWLEDTELFLATKVTHGEQPRLDRKKIKLRPGSLDEEDERDDETENESILQEGDAEKLISISAEELQSGRMLLYRHTTATANQALPEKDSVVFSVYPARLSSRRKRKGGSRLSIPLTLSIGGATSVQVTRFPNQLSIVAGQTAILRAPDFQASSSSIRSSSPELLSYRLIQPPSNGVEVQVLEGNDSGTDILPSWARATYFTQAQLNKGLVRLEHNPLPGTEFDGDSKDFDAMTMEIGEGVTRVLLVRLEPLQLALLNNSAIQFVQGNTYVVLSKSHLGAISNGGTEKVHYNITRSPQNGSLYWVDGEREASWFTQKDIDIGAILYAQLNMGAYEDSFNFVVGNDEMELAEKYSTIRVLPAAETQGLTTQARTITRITLLHLNASTLGDKDTPRYIVVKAPNYGRLFLHPTSNKSITFFTHADIKHGLLFFHAFDVESRIMDDVELELRSDNTQPARFHWPIDIHPFELGGVPLAGQAKGGRRLLPAAKHNTLDESIHPNQPAEPPELNYHFPLVILGAVVLSVSVALLCRKTRPQSRKKSSGATSDEGNHLTDRLGRSLPDLDDVLGRTPKVGNGTGNLFDATVYGKQQQGGHADVSAITTSPFALPSSKRSVVISTDAPGIMKTFDDEQAPPRKRTVQQQQNGVSSTPAPHKTILTSAARQSMQRALLAAAATARSSGTDPRIDADQEPRLQNARSHGESEIKRNSNTRLKDNQYWV